MANDPIAQILTRLELLEGAGAAAGGQCSAQFPHDTLRYDRRRYLCACGKRYTKDGIGGLMEVPVGS